MNKVIASILMSLLLAFSAQAMTLKEAKSGGYLGEQLNGYLGLVKNNAEAATLMKSVNAKRRAHYQKLAKKNKISLADVAKLAGSKAIGKTAKGHYIQNSAGKWVKK